MKNVQLFLNVLFAVAVITLFALFLNGKKTSSAGVVLSDKLNSADSGLKIAFFYSDSVTANYEMFKKEKETLDKKMKEAEDQFAARQRVFEKEATDFQQRAQYLTITEKEQRQEKLYMQQQELMRMEQVLTNELAKAEADVNLRIANEMEGFLKEYAQRHGLSYILSYKQGANIWYADKGLDITTDILKELNELYQKKKPE